MTSETKAKIKKAIKITSSVLWWCALGLIFVIMVSVIGAKMTGKVPSVCGYSVMHIISGSMEEEIPQGSYILVKRISPDEVKINEERAKVWLSNGAQPTDTVRALLKKTNIID